MRNLVKPSTQKKYTNSQIEDPPFQTSDQALNEDLVLELSLGSGGLRLAVQVLEHVAGHQEGEAGEHDGAEEEHLHQRLV